MGRYALAGTSLVAAIPAIGLAYVTIMAFVQHADDMPVIMLVVNGAATAIAVLLAVTPVAIVIGKRSDKKDVEPTGAAEASEGDADEAAVSAAHTAEVVMDDDEDEEPEEQDIADDMDLDAVETDAFEFDMDDMDEASASSDDAFEFDDEDDELK